MIWRVFAAWSTRVGDLGRRSCRGPWVSAEIRDSRGRSGAGRANIAAAPAPRRAPPPSSCRHPCRRSGPGLRPASPARRSPAASWSCPRRCGPAERRIRRPRPSGSSPCSARVPPKRLVTFCNSIRAIRRPSSVTGRSRRRRNAPGAGRASTQTFCLRRAAKPALAAGAQRCVADADIDDVVAAERLDIGGFGLDVAFGRIVRQQHRLGPDAELGRRAVEMGDGGGRYSKPIRAADAQDRVGFRTFDLRRRSRSSPASPRTARRRGWRGAGRPRPGAPTCCSRPSCMTTIRSASDIASTWSWVT